jgi:hypothetical protein
MIHRQRFQHRGLAGLVSDASEDPEGEIQVDRGGVGPTQDLVRHRNHLQERCGA